MGSARRRGGPGVPLERYPIPRNNVAVILDDGRVSHFITQAEASSFVEKKFSAHWDGIALGYSDNCKAIRMIPEPLLSRGFLDAWRKRPSGNYLPKELSEILPRNGRGMRGEFTMQLV